MQKNENITAILDIEDLISLEHILSDYKRVLKENGILKEEKEQAWEEWNNLEQGSYETEQKLKQQIKESQKENEELKLDLHEMTISNEHKKKEWIHKAILNSYIPKQKIKDRIEELKLLDFGTNLVSQSTANLTTICILQQLLESEENCGE